MTDVLCDTFSIYSFNEYYDKVPDLVNINALEDSFHLIENLILCENIFLDQNGVQYFGLGDLCNVFDVALKYTNIPELYVSSEGNNTYVRNGAIDCGGSINERSVHYIKKAHDLGIYFSPHPAREESIFSKINTHHIRASKLIVDTYDQKMYQSESGQLTNINITVPAAVEHALYFAKKNKLKLSQSILEIRESKNAKEFRRYCKSLDLELRDLTPRKRMLASQRLLGDLNEVIGKWAEDLDDGVKYKKRSINLSKLPFVGKWLGFLEIERGRSKFCVIKNRSCMLAT